ncbi:hypothetical protein Asppvi_006021 [Aspergillus pseudoviridinutans]|uniref:Uncharacterized protein n=1 Tax=Aspergillus pseudoviridinutans TaxID=1517512 RepID=A0A9P3BDE7_9EURO|nr:uncharacterized protein Asppvi_006021 [Aspergillus pseudoviridinutans]GIJ87118.1 hypothetical protein Asppvi_006021 [Aspergillus pseudoviridinutans]
MVVKDSNLFGGKLRAVLIKRAISFGNPQDGNLQAVKTDTPINRTEEQHERDLHRSQTAAGTVDDRRRDPRQVSGRNWSPSPETSALSVRHHVESRGEEAARNREGSSRSEDEATPNAAPVVFLQCLTGLVIRPPDRVGLQYDIFHPIKTVAPLSIVEPKKRMRHKRTVAYIMPEGPQPPGIQQSLPIHSLLLVSQDRHEIFLTFAAYTQAYKGYLGGEEARADSFLVMERLGHGARANLLR